MDQRDNERIQRIQSLLDEAEDLAVECGLDPAELDEDEGPEEDDEE